MENNIGKLGKLLILTVILFCIALFVAGDLFGMMHNANCFKYLGCNIGFFGYDALVHFIAGIMLVLFIIWLARKYQKFDILPGTLWKNIFVLISTVAFIGVAWEFLEFLGDRFRIYILHTNLFNPNNLYQASNSDTMGDMFFSLIGAAITLFILKHFHIDNLISPPKNETNINGPELNG